MLVVCIGKLIVPVEIIDVVVKVQGLNQSGQRTEDLTGFDMVLRLGRTVSFPFAFHPFGWFPRMTRFSRHGSDLTASLPLPWRETCVI